MQGQIVTEERYMRLMQEAVRARKSAYAPYSAFPVGAAILFDDGTVVSGCNVENASFGLTICAERNAMCAAVAIDCTKPIVAAVAGEDGKLCPPCGACRQFLFEFNPELLILLQDGEALVAYRLADLLPVSFSGQDLGEVDCKCRK